MLEIVGSRPAVLVFFGAIVVRFEKRVRNSNV